MEVDAEKARRGENELRRGKKDRKKDRKSGGRTRMERGEAFIADLMHNAMKGAVQPSSGKAVRDPYDSTTDQDGPSRLSLPGPSRAYDAMQGL